MLFPACPHAQVAVAKQEKAKAIASKDDYKARCRQAEEKLRDMKADKEAAQKALNKKVSSVLKHSSMRIG